MRQKFDSFLSSFVSRINDPSIGLHEYCWTKVFLGRPPIARARSGARCTKDTFVESIKELSVFDGLKILFLTWFFRSIPL